MIRQPNTGEEIWPSKTAVWRYSQERHKEHEEQNLVWWGKEGLNGTPRYKRFLSNLDGGVVSQTIWTWDDVGHTQDGKREQLSLQPNNPFATPKPEKIISRILQLATEPGDWVLDSFAGSGTTGAVAHKMGRRWILVELGEHCETHILPRLRRVVDGTDSGGVTAAANWKGGGGFRYLRLAPSLLELDKWGNWIINTTYNIAMLAEALCKVEGFTYEPSDSIYWQMGRSTETDYLYATPETLTEARMRQISEDVGPERSLLILCLAFRGAADAYDNLTIKKIPKEILTACEWGHDDYSLKVENLPQAPAPPPAPQTRLDLEDASL